ncbi:MAG: hypothetical protein OEZ36_03250 [Spirochaetota bacterium]|nr:hypothetical protein [Spirochaetota bacterium]
MKSTIIYKTILSYKEEGAESTLYCTVDSDGKQKFHIMSPEEVLEQLIRMN